MPACSTWSPADTGDRCRSAFATCYLLISRHRIEKYQSLAPDPSFAPHAGASLNNTNQTRTRWRAIEFPAGRRAGLAVRELVYHAYDQQMVVLSKSGPGE